MILDLVPRHLGADVDVPLFFGRVSRMSVDRARRVSDQIRLAVVIDEQLAAAGPAEATMNLIRRVEGAQVVLALLDTKRLSWKVGVGGEQRAVHTSTHAAVAVIQLFRGRRDAEVNRSTLAVTVDRGEIGHAFLRVIGPDF